MKHTNYLLLFFATVLFLQLTACQIDSASQLNVKVEGIEVLKEHSNAWTVKGMVRNMGAKQLKGAVRIKFLNANNDILYTAKAKVNDGDYLGIGQAGSFRTTQPPSSFDGVVDFDVIFYER